MYDFILITILLTVAIYRIRKYSRMLVQNKIFANERLMCAHLMSFAVITALDYIITSIIVNLSDIPEAELNFQ